MLSERLPYLRKINNFIQSDLANALQTTKATISNWENDYSSPSNDMLVLLARNLNCTVDYLLGINDDNKYFNSDELNMWYKKLPYEN